MSSFLFKYPLARSNTHSFAVGTQTPPTLERGTSRPLPKIGSQSNIDPKIIVQAWFRVSCGFLVFTHTLISEVNFRKIVETTAEVVPLISPISRPHERAIGWSKLDRTGVLKFWLTLQEQPRYLVCGPLSQDFISCDIDYRLTP